jgi:hypothetical protein
MIKIIQAFIFMILIIFVSVSRHPFPFSSVVETLQTITCLLLCIIYVEIGK